MESINPDMVVDTPPEYDTRHEPAAFDALHSLEERLRAVLGCEVYFVAVVAFPDGAGSLQVDRYSNCGDLAAFLLDKAITLPDTSAARQ